MAFLKRLFRRQEEPEGEAYVPTPTQVVPGLEPIVVQAIESLFPDAGAQKKAFAYALEYKRACTEKIRRDDLTGLLALLAYSKGRVQRLPEPSLWFFGRFRLEEIDYMFRTMRDAEEWVRSISGPKP